MNLHCEASPGPFTAAQGAELDNLTTDLARVFPAEGVPAIAAVYERDPILNPAGGTDFKMGMGAATKCKPCNTETTHRMLVIGNLSPTAKRQGL